jgi:hypothetical protein
MSRSLSASSVSTKDNVLDRVEPRMVKAELDSQTLSNEMTGLVRDALVRHFGSFKAAAIEMAMDQGQLTRELDAGKLNLARLTKCGPAFLLKFGQLMVEHAQPLSTPKSRVRQQLRLIRESLAEIDQYLEHIA